MSEMVDVETEVEADVETEVVSDIEEGDGEGLGAPSLAAGLEALLLLADEPMSALTLAAITRQPLMDVERVLAEFRDAGRTGAQHGIGAGRAITANDPDRLSIADLLLHGPEDVDGLRVHLGRLILAPVAHEPVDLLERVGIVLPVALVGDGEVFAGVNAMQRDGAGVAVGNGSLRILESEYGHQRRQRGTRKTRRAIR